MAFRGGMHAETLRRAFFDPARVLTSGGVTLAAALELVRSEGSSRAAVTVVCPTGTPPWLQPAATRREATQRADMLLPPALRRAETRALPRRTLAGDARDLLVNTVAESTGISLPSMNADDPRIDTSSERGFIHLGMSHRVGRSYGVSGGGSIPSSARRAEYARAIPVRAWTATASRWSCSATVARRT